MGKKQANIRGAKGVRPASSASDGVPRVLPLNDAANGQVQDQMVPGPPTGPTGTALRAADAFNRIVAVEVGGHVI